MHSSSLTPSLADESKTALLVSSDDSLEFVSSSVLFSCISSEAAGDGVGAFVMNWIGTSESDGSDTKCTVPKLNPSDSAIGLGVGEAPVSS